MSKINTFLLCLLFLGGCQDFPAKGNSDFEEMLSGFPTCVIEGVYVNYYGEQTPVHKYFLDRDLKPSLVKDEDGFAHFDIDEDFHGLKVYKIIIPGTRAYHAIFFQEPVTEVKKKLKPLFHRGFDSSSDLNCGVKPVLAEYPDDSDWSILWCNPKPTD